MRVAVSDYDGTLNINHQVSEKTVAAIAAWREAGNVFGIATGRDRSLIVHEITRWGIPFDFLVCCNGSALYDAELNLLEHTDIPDEMVMEIVRHPAALESTHFQFSGNGGSKVYIKSSASIFQNFTAPHTKIAVEALPLQTGLQQLSLGFTDEVQCQRCSDSLMEAFKGKLSFNRNYPYVDINGPGVNKLTGILNMLAIQKWPARGLLAIGDNENDVSMIRYFNGFSVISQNRSATKAAAAIFGSVGEMLAEHL